MVPDFIVEYSRGMVIIPIIALGNNLIKNVVFAACYRRQNDQSADRFLNSI